MTEDLRQRGAGIDMGGGRGDDRPCNILVDIGTADAANQGSISTMSSPRRPLGAGTSSTRISFLE